MDQVASTLLAFPPSEGFQQVYNDDQAYDAAAKAHVQRLDKLMKDKAGHLASHSAQMLQHVNPAFNSISSLYLLHSLYAGHGKKPETGIPPDHLVNFIFKYDPRQIRYAGHIFNEFLQIFYHGDHFPPSIAVELLTTALLRLDPTRSMFTSHHLPLVKLAYNSNNIEPALPIITRPIVFYPGMRGQTEPRPLCDMRLPPSSYITVESGLTSRVSSSAVLEYDLCVGLCHLQHRQYRLAAAALERVLTYPTKEHGCSKIMVEAHNKWVLVSLLEKGKLEPHPAVSQTVQAAYSKVGWPYVNVAKAFEKPDNAAGLKKQVESVGMQVFAEEGNVSLIRQVLAQYQPHHILRLRDIYSKLSIEDIRLLTESAETGAHLETAGEVEVLLQDMISTGMLKGVLAKPTGSVSGDGQGHLTFLTEEEEVDEHRYMEEMLSLQQRVESLGPILTATNERLSTSRDFVKHLVKTENNAKDRSGAGAGGKEIDLSYDSQVEDEDLMVGN